MAIKLFSIRAAAAKGINACLFKNEHGTFCVLEGRQADGQGVCTHWQLRYGSSHYRGHSPAAVKREP